MLSAGKCFSQPAMTKWISRASLEKVKQLAPAQRLGLVDRYYTIQDILCFKGLDIPVAN